MKETTNVINIFKKCIIDTIGQETYDKKIIKIADILNELDYKGIDLPAKTTAGLVIDIIEDKGKNILRTTAQNEISLQFRPTNPGGLCLGKWKWKFTTDKIALLQTIEKRKKDHITWAEIKKELGVDARSFIYNIIKARVYATKIEMNIAHRIWKNLIRQEG